MNLSESLFKKMVCMFYFIDWLIVVSEIDPPPPNYDGYVDIKKFWEAVTIEMISRGFYTSMSCVTFQIYSF